MATQTDVQQLIQGLTPTAVNNGNPNTAYNNSARTVINPNDYVARISGAPIPQMDAQGNWLMGQISQSPTVDFSPRDLTALLPRTQINMPVMPRLPMLGGGGGGGTAPVVTPPTTQPPVVNPPVGTGGNTPPSTGGGLPPFTQGGGGNSNTGPSVMDLLSQGGISGVGGLGGTGSVGGVGTSTPSNPLSGWGDGISLPEFLQGASGAGGITLEVLDKLSELFLPGDMVQQGNFNINQLIDSIANKAGVPVGTIAQLLGQGDKYNAWLASGFGDLQGDLRFSPTSFGNNSGWGFGQVNPITGQLALGLLNNIVVPNSGVPTTFDQNSALAAAFGPNWAVNNATSGGGGARSAFLGTNAAPTQEQIDAAQQAFGAMKEGAFQQRQTGGDILGRKYEF